MSAPLTAGVNYVAILNLKPLYLSHFTIFSPEFNHVGLALLQSTVLNPKIVPSSSCLCEIKRNVPKQCPVTKTRLTVTIGVEMPPHTAFCNYFYSGRFKGLVIGFVQGGVWYGVDWCVPIRVLCNKRRICRQWIKIFMKNHENYLSLCNILTLNMLIAKTILDYLFYLVVGN